MVEPITTGVVAGGGLLAAIVGKDIAALINDLIGMLHDGFELIKVLYAGLTIVAILAAISGVSVPAGTPFMAFSGVSVMSNYVIGFPDCSSALGPIEFCALPSKALFTALPDTFDSLKTNFAGLLGANQEEGAQAYIDFMQSLIGLLFVWVPLLILTIKLILTAEGAASIIQTYSQYRNAHLNW